MPPRAPNKPSKGNYSDSDYDEDVDVVDIDAEFDEEGAASRTRLKGKGKEVAPGAPGIRGKKIAGTGQDVSRTVLERCRPR